MNFKSLPETGIVKPALSPTVMLVVLGLARISPICGGSELDPHPDNKPIPMSRTAFRKIFREIILGLFV
jgi:hypothetical protein